MSIAALAVAFAWTCQQWRFAHLAAAGHWDKAVQVWPDSAYGWRQLALNTWERDPNRALACLRSSLAANSNDWTTWAELADLQIETGDVNSARASYDAMLDRNAGFDGWWRYANFLLFTGHRAEFWSAAERALNAAPPDRFADVFEEISLVSADNPARVDSIVEYARALSNPQRRAMLFSSYETFLLDRQRFDGAAGFFVHAQLTRLDWKMLIHEELPAKMYLRLLQANRPTGASAMQVRAIASGLVPPLPCRRVLPRDELSDIDVIAGEDGAHWHFPSSAVPEYVLPDLGHERTLRIDLDGNQADQLALIDEPILLSRPGEYTLNWSARTAADALGSGVSICLLDSTSLHRSGQAVDRSGDWTTMQLAFVTKRAPAVVHVMVSYDRPSGDVPFSGTIWVRELTLDEAGCGRTNERTF